jgi:plasmid stability protein
MAELVIEGVPDEVIDRLQRKAVRRGTSLNAEALTALERWAASELPMPEAVLAHIRAGRDGLSE